MPGATASVQSLFRRASITGYHEFAPNGCWREGLGSGIRLCRLPWLRFVAPFPFSPSTITSRNRASGILREFEETTANGTDAKPSRSGTRYRILNGLRTVTSGSPSATVCEPVRGGSSPRSISGSSMSLRVATTVPCGALPRTNGRNRPRPQGGLRKRQHRRHDATGTHR